MSAVSPAENSHEGADTYEKDYEVGESQFAARLEVECISAAVSVNIVLESH